MSEFLPSDIEFVSSAELRASVPPEPAWNLQGYVAPRNLTILAGKPKAGKSTLALATANAIASTAASFLGHSIDGGPVVYVSEEGAGTLAHKAGTGDIRFATRDTAWPRPDWETLVAAARAEASRVQAKVIVIDTFAAWAGLGPESEKDAGTIQEAIEPLLELTRKGFAVLLVVHTRKGGGEDGEGIRGSGALAGAADIILELERVQGAPPRQRKLLALSRYPQTPGVLVIEHDPDIGAWTAIGEATDRGDAREITDRAALTAAFRHTEALTRQELEEAVGSPERQWHNTLERLIEAGAVVKTGAGKKGDPYRYKMLRADAAQASEQDPRRNGAVGAFDNAAHPAGVQHQKHATAETFLPLRCAVSNPGAATNTSADDADELGLDDFETEVLRRHEGRRS
jgi:AAA domain